MNLYKRILFIHTIIGDNMDENLEMLEYMHKNASMGAFTLTSLINELNDKENKIKKVVQDELTEYKKFVKEIEKLYKKGKYEKSKISLMTKMMSSMGIKKEVLKDNSDAAIAHMLTEGITMGVVDISTKIKNFEGIVNKDIIKLAKKYLDYQQKEIDTLKEYM